MAAVLPELPTLAETGLPGFNAVGWFGLFAAARTPQPGTPEELRRHLAREIEVWGKVIRDAGLKAE
jgi:tripartite-type tricarboxylate transporter receptor subunit TctC